jgi:hypothetical protein
MSSSPIAVVDEYYRSWVTGGHFRLELFAPDLKFIGPIDQFESRERLLEVGKQFGPAVKEIKMIKQFVDGDSVCSIYDFVTSTPVGTIPTAELIRVSGGQIAEIRLYYDARELAKVMGK